MMMKPSRFYPVFLVITAIGVYLRLDQFLLQVLLDDEWHVIHQLLVKTPTELFLTFGHSDFSIPLALMYWLESNLFGLSEIGMRWPMMLAGLLSLLVLPLYVRRYLGDKTTLLFAAFLAISPMLIIYSRTARPYALTLLLSLMALGAIYQFAVTKKSSWRTGLFYAVCAWSSVWLHLISLAFVAAPFLALGLPAVIKRDWRLVTRLIYLGMFTAAGLMVLILPPLLGHPEALAVKLGAQTPDLQTYHGALYVWLGTSSISVLLIALCLAALGAGTVWKKLTLIPGLMTGLILALTLVLLTQPAWVHHPLTLARYLLPALPLFLLSIATGLAGLSDAMVIKWGKPGKAASMAVTVFVLLLMTYYSPLDKILAKPNSNSLHSTYQFDFRDDKNLIALYQKDFPLSPFWQQLADHPRDSLKIAVSPFSFETQYWDAARWEQISRQRVMPGYLIGLCGGHRSGEVPNGDGYHFQNVGYLADQSDLLKRGFDLVVYQKPLTVMTNQGEREFGLKTADCGLKFREQFSEPVYEDQWLLVFSLSDRKVGQQGDKQGQPDL